MDSSSGQKSPRRSFGLLGKTTCWSAINSLTVGCPSRAYFSANDIDDSSLAQTCIRLTASSITRPGSAAGYRLKTSIPGASPDRTRTVADRPLLATGLRARIARAAIARSAPVDIPAVGQRHPPRVNQVGAVFSAIAVDDQAVAEFDVAPLEPAAR